MGELLEISKELERIEEKLDIALGNHPAKGVKRTTDPLGRLTIPKEYRKALAITEDTELEICMVNGALLVKIV